MEKSSFFNSVAGDQKYDASMFAAYFNSFVSNGVFPNPGTNLQVVANNNMTVTVSIGKGWINGYFYLNDAILILPLDVADGVLKRYDRIVLQLNTINRSITAKVKKGTFASTPVAPTLQRDADAYELALGDVYVGAGVISVVGANITDQRLNTALCGIVNSLIQADTTAIFNQYQAWFIAQSGVYAAEMIANEATFQSQFDAWFATIQGMLSGDIAGNLANQITALAGVGRTTETVKGVADSVTTHLADYVRQPAYGPAAGAVNAYTFGAMVAVALVDGMSVYLDNVIAANTGASTFNWSGLGAVAITDAKGLALTAEKMPLNGIIGLRYNASVPSFQLLGEGGEYGTAGQLQVLTGYTVGTPSGVVGGTMPSKIGSATVITPSFAAQAFPQGYYDGTLGSGKVVPVTIAAGDSVIATSIPEAYYQDVAGMTWVKKKEILIKASGTVRVKFDLYSGWAGFNAYGKVYKNGIAVGIQRSENTNSTWASFSEDFACSAGDLMQGYTACASAGKSVYMKNFKLCIDLSPYGTINI